MASTVPETTLVARRYGTYRAIQRHCLQERIDPERFWAIPFDRLRFSVGESFQNLKVPFATAPVFTKAVEEAIDELLLLAQIRHSDRLEPEEYERISQLPAYASIDLDAASYSLTAGTAGAAAPFSEKVARAQVALDPWLDPALVRHWLARGKGAALAAQLGSVCRKSLVEEHNLYRKEPSAYLNQLAVLRHLLPIWSARLATLANAAFAARAEPAVALLMYALFDEAFSAVLDSPVIQESAGIHPHTPTALRSTVSPATFVRDPGRALTWEINPYGFSPDLFADVMWHWRGVDLVRNDLDASIEVAASRTALKQLTPVVEAAWIRDVRMHIARVLAHDVSPSVDLAIELASLMNDPRRVRETAFGRATRGKLLLRFQQERGDPGLVARLGALSQHLGSAELLQRMPTKAFGRDVVPEALLREAVAGVAVYQIDRQAKEIVDRAASVLVDRRAEERTVTQVRAEYESGRLYRIAADDLPILRQEIVREEGHFFIDLKDFTKKTHSLKEVNMADFLKREFYGPLLAIAGDLIKKRGPQTIVLNNLLGDALCVSGEMISLIDFADAAQEMLNRYREKLRARMPESVVKGELERLRAKFLEENKKLEERRRSLVEERTAIESAASREEERSGEFHTGAGVLGDLHRIDNELFRLEELAAKLKEELTQSQEFLLGSDLTAGAFISFGSQALLLTLPETAFGSVKVAIAEKINEAARGTARNGEVKRRLDAVVAEARATSGVPTLTYPFRVFVDKVWNLAIPPSLATHLGNAIDAKDPLLAANVFAGIGEQARAEFADAVARGGALTLDILTGTQDLYNAGVALSEEALGAFQRVTRDRRAFLDKTISVAELDREFHAMFAFDGPSIRLVFVLPVDADRPSHIFRYAGSMVFRGFERRNATSVFELLNPRDPFSRMIVERWFPRWYEEFRKKRA